MPHILEFIKLQEIKDLSALFTTVSPSPKIVPANHKHPIHICSLNDIDLLIKLIIFKNQSITLIWNSYSSTCVNY